MNKHKNLACNIPILEQLKWVIFFFHVMTAFCALKDSSEGFVKVTVPFGHLNVYLETVNYLEG